MRNPLAVLLATGLLLGASLGSAWARVAADEDQRGDCAAQAEEMDQNELDVQCDDEDTDVDEAQPNEADHKDMNTVQNGQKADVDDEENGEHDNDDED